MTDHALASFEAKDGTGRWEVLPGALSPTASATTSRSSPISCAPACPGRTEKHVYQTEEDDGFGLWAALAPSTKRPEALPTPASLPGLWAVRALKPTSTRGRSPAT